MNLVFRIIYQNSNGTNFIFYIPVGWLKLFETQSPFNVLHFMILELQPELKLVNVYNCFRQFTFCVYGKTKN